MLEVRVGGPGITRRRRNQETIHVELDKQLVHLKVAQVGHVERHATPLERVAQQEVGAQVGGRVFFLGCLLDVAVCIWLPDAFGLDANNFLIALCALVPT